MPQSLAGVDPPPGQARRDGARRLLDRLVEAHPKWRARLTLIAETLLSIADPVQDELGVETDDSGRASVPLLAGATLTQPRGFADAWVRDLFEQAGANGEAALESFGALAASDALDAAALLEAALQHDDDGMAAIAGAPGLDIDALSPIAQLATVPLLRACRRLAPEVPPDWAGGATRSVAAGRP